MRRLMLLRHATAVPHGSMPDPERVLSGQGQEEAAAVARYCLEAMLLPDHCLVSPSARTLQTLAPVRAAIPDMTSRTIPALYAMQADELLAALQDMAGLAGEEVRQARTVLLVGHNPTCTELAQQLVGFGDRYAFARLKGDFPPAGLAVLDFDIDEWSQIGAGAGRLDRFWTPSVGN